jgi:hypothetical protein
VGGLVAVAALGVVAVDVEAEDGAPAAALGLPAAVTRIQRVASNGRGAIGMGGAVRVDRWGGFIAGLERTRRVW